MSEFLSGVKEKYPEALLKGRLTVEGNVIGCFFQDPLLLDETTCTPEDFITSDGHFYFTLIKMLRNKNINEITDVDILSLNTDIYETYDELGGWDTIEHLKEVIDLRNFDTYIDVLYRENIFIKMYADGFNLTEPIEIDGKKKIPLKFLRRCTAEEVIDWWESRLTTYGGGYSSKILEEETIEFTDDFIQSCLEGEETGVPFRTAGIDINGEEINCFPFLSNQCSGLLPGTLSMIGGFSSTGKSTWLVTLMMALMSQGQKIILISNEESIKKYKIKFLVWLLGKRNRYWNLTKKKLTSGDISEEDREQLRYIQTYWKENYKDKLKMVSINDADMMVVKKKIREAALRYGYTCFVYDTFKIQEQDYQGSRTDLALVHDSRELHKLAMKYNMIGLASIQLAEYMRGSLTLTAQHLSNAKQIKEVLENLWLMRNLYNTEELDPKNKLYCRPFRLKRVDDKWIEEPFEPDPMETYRCLFVEKCRGGDNSADNGRAYLLKYSGNFCIFRETAQIHSKHGRID